MYHSYAANQGKHWKRSDNGRIMKHTIRAKFSDEELRRVESKISELYERNDECSITDVVDYFDEEKEKYRISKKRPGRPNYHDGGSSISKNKVYVIIDYLTSNRKTMKCVTGVGQTRTNLEPITISEQLRKHSSMHFFKLLSHGI